MFLAIECDENDITQVTNGYTNGGIYRYPHSVQFGCFPGYVFGRFGRDLVSRKWRMEWNTSELPSYVAAIFHLV